MLWPLREKYDFTVLADMYGVPIKIIADHMMTYDQTYVTIYLPN